ncbi:fused MFS/spermidine synthase, partial [PVC group bacterium]|nr:fused MFS/spermidine synthase [PVC group bacterium]
MERSTRRTVLFLFFVSGISGLIYEVAWTRLLTTMVGNTVHAVTIVLAAFMAGLALGSQVGGRLIDRRDDALRVFAVLQIAIGVISFYLTAALSTATPVYVWLHRVAEGNTVLLNGGRLAFSFCLLVVPTTLMGATLPVLSRAAVQRRGTLGLELGTLYALNTLGAAAGCYIAGFVLIGGVGIRISTWGAAVLNVAVGVWAYVSYRHLGSPDEAEEVGATEPEPMATRRPVALLVLGAMAVSGFAALGYEVLWTRALVFFMGNSVYAFSAMLTTFLGGLALGSMAAARLADRWRRPVLVLGLIEAGIGMYALLSILLFAWGLGSAGSLYPPLSWERPLSQFAKVAAVMFVPTFLLGATFPLAARVYVLHLEQVGRKVGTLYMWNTLGGILGAAVTGFALLPAFGVEASLRLLCLINLLLGLVLVIAESAVRLRWRVVLAVALVSAGVIGGRAVPRDVFRRLHEGGPMDAEVIAYHEDATAAVAVVQEKENVSLRIDNHPVAGTELGYQCSQTFLGHLPLLLHPNPQSVFVLGFGAGGSCYSVSRHPEVKRIDAAELCPGVVRFAPLLASINRNILAEPYVTLDVNDGRNALLAARETYDVISVDLLLPHAAGAGSLYAKEFYEVCSQRLNDGGIVAEWIAPHRVSPAHLRIILGTAKSVFPHVALWYTRQYTHLVLVASRSPMRIDYTRLSNRMKTTGVARDLSAIGVDGPEALLSYFVADDDALARFLGKTGLI